MQPIGQSFPVELPLLAKVPMEIKLHVLKCLDIPLLATTSVLNKFWQKMGADNRVWRQVAAQLNITGQLKDAKQEVMDYLKYHSTVEVVEEFLNRQVNVSAEVNKAKKESENKNVKEKYQTILKSFISGVAGDFSDFMREILKTQLLLPKHIQALKQLIEDGALTEEKIDSRHLFVPDDQIEIFQCLINKFKHRKDVLTEATGWFAFSQSHNKAAFLKALCISGVHPDASHFVDAARSRHQNAHLQVLLDYSDETVRKDAIDNIKMKLKTLSEKEDLNSVEALWRKRFTKAVEIIQKAPSPTYGGQTCNL